MAAQPRLSLGDDPGTIRPDPGTRGVAIRAGLHTGECEFTAGALGGLAVQIAAGVMAQARPGEALVSGTVKDLVAGAGFTFEERGPHTLAGIAGEWPLFELNPVLRVPRSGGVSKAEGNDGEGIRQFVDPLIH